jgi:hypothetical protein
MKTKDKPRYTKGGMVRKYNDDKDEGVKESLDDGVDELDEDADGSVGW